jgi:hypothetical protein
LREFGVESDRAIKYWVKIGKKLGRLPPLDEPGKMAAWWAAAMVTKVPEKLLSLSEQSQTDLLVFAVFAAAPPPSAPASDPRDFSDIKSLDPAANVEALRHSLAITKKLLDDAMVGTDENLISLRTRNYNSTFDLWRLAEQTLVKVQRERGEVIEREAIAAEIAQACETLALMRQSMPARVLVELEKILPRRLANPESAPAASPHRGRSRPLQRRTNPSQPHRHRFPAALSSLLAA